MGGSFSPTSAACLSVACAVLSALIVVVSGAVAADASLPSPQLKRYPFLTDVVGSYATINWGTDRSGTEGVVKWGEVAAGSCTANSKSSATSSSVTKTSITVNSVSEYQWRARLSGLKADVQYCYRVYLGTVDLLGGDPSPTFSTQVPVGSAASFSFAVFGDWGSVDSTGQNPHQANVLRQIANSGARFAVTTGDVPYGSASQTNYGDLVDAKSAVFGPLFWTVAGSSIPFFSVLGNHGLTSAFLTNWRETRAVSTSGGRYQMDTYCCLDGTTSKSYPTVWYAFDAGRVRVYVLDTAWDEANVGSGSQYKDDYDYHWAPTSVQYQWLQSDLSSHPTALKLAFFHYPLYSDNAGQPSDTYLRMDGPGGAASLEGLLSRYGVKLAFNGHAHIYERNKPQNSVVTYVTGGGGAPLFAVDHCSTFDAYAIGWSPSTNSGRSCNAPRPASMDQLYHFLLVSVTGAQVTVTPIDELGRAFDVQTYAF